MGVTFHAFLSLAMSPFSLLLHLFVCLSVCRLFINVVGILSVCLSLTLLSVYFCDFCLSLTLLSIYFCDFCLSLTLLSIYFECFFLFVCLYITLISINSVCLFVCLSLFSLCQTIHLSDFDFLFFFRITTLSFFCVYFLLICHLDFFLCLYGLMLVYLSSDGFYFCLIVNLICQNVTRLSDFH